METQLVKSWIDDSFFCGRFTLHPSEMCFVQYMPIKMKGQKVYSLPDHLKFTTDIVWLAQHLEKQYCDVVDKYMYLTVKHLYVTHGNIGNRPGWHIDGYLSDDVNYIWSDWLGTDIALGDFILPLDHEESLLAMDRQVDPDMILRTPPNELVRLNNQIVHRSPSVPRGGYGTFVKVSFSDHRYNLQGNAHNPVLKHDWKMYPRSDSRNHPFVLED